MIVQIGADGEIFLRTISHLIYSLPRNCLGKPDVHLPVRPHARGRGRIRVRNPSIRCPSLPIRNLQSCILRIGCRGSFRVPVAISFGYTDTQEPFFMMVFDTLGVPVFSPTCSRWYLLSVNHPYEISPFRPKRGSNCTYSGMPICTCGMGRALPDQVMLPLLSS